MLRQIAEAIAPFFDKSLPVRVIRAKMGWQEEAQEAVRRQAGEHLEPLRAAELLDEKRAEIKAILDTVQIDADDFDEISRARWEERFRRDNPT